MQLNRMYENNTPTNNKEKTVICNKSLKQKETTLYIPDEMIQVLYNWANFINIKGLLSYPLIQN